jgi:TonB family protein
VVNDTIPGEEIFKVVEESPRFPGCEDILEKQERQECAQKKMLEYLYTNIKYPESARKAGVEGMVVIQFVIEKDGSVSNTKVLRDIGEGCGEEGMRVMNMMNSEGIRWIPGIQKGEAVRVQFALPISFKLDKKKKEGDLPSAPPPPPPVKINPDFPPPPPPPPSSEDKPVFIIVEEMPYLAICKEEKDNEVRYKCSQKAMLEKLYSNVKYPEIARKNGIQGKVILSFVVNTDGTASDHKILRDIGANCGEAAMEAVKLLQDWVPGKQRGKAVRVQYTLPVMFKLDAKKKNEVKGNSE